jgi:ornithine cyclodeaminase/alanine dehydrogenase-like protein (mu-crystallin family)
MQIPVIDAEELRRVLPMDAAVDALEEAFRNPLPQAPLRSQVDTPAGSLLLMPAASASGVGVKLVTLTPENLDRGLPLIHATYALFDAVTQAPVALVDGAALTALRTAAVSGLATRFLAEPEVARLVLFGAGVQATTHLEAMLAVRSFDEVVVVSRSAEPAEALVSAARSLGLHAEIGVPEAVADAQVICTCTTSPTPVFDGHLLAEGAHVNAIGAYTPQTRELDGEAIRRARVVVETREVAMAEAGDVLIPLREGVIDETHIVADLSEVVAGASVRRSSGDVTVFKSVGVAFEDLVLAHAAAERRDG